MFRYLSAWIIINPVFPRGKKPDSYSTGTPAVLQRYSSRTPRVLQLFFGVPGVLLFSPLFPSQYCMAVTKFFFRRMDTVIFDDTFKLRKINKEAVFWHFQFELYDDVFPFLSFEKSMRQINVMTHFLPILVNSKTTLEINPSIRLLLRLRKG